MSRTEPGSAQSWIPNKSIRSIFDPASPLTMSVPSSTLNLVLNFFQNPVCLFDNMGSIPSQTADDFCKAVTGAGFAIRALYTNSHLIHYNYKRERLVRNRTSLCNQIRGLLLESGVSVPQGVSKIRCALPAIFELACTQDEQHILFRPPSFA